MKKLILFAVLLGLLAGWASNACAATAVIRSGAYMDQYTITDTGGDYDGYIVYFAHRVNEVIVQYSATNYQTYSESQLCWSDPDETLCPHDVVEAGPPVEYRMPTLMFIDSIMAGGGVSTGDPLTEAEEKMLYLAFWNEYKLKGLLVDALAEMVTEGLNENQTKRSLKYVLFGNGVDLTTAETLSTDRVVNGQLHAYNELGLDNVPYHDRRCLEVLDEADWF